MYILHEKAHYYSMIFTKIVINRHIINKYIKKELYIKGNIISLSFSLSLSLSLIFSTENDLLYYDFYIFDLNFNAYMSCSHEYCHQMKTFYFFNTISITRSLFHFSLHQ